MKKRRLVSLFLSFLLLLPLFSLTSADAYESFDLDARAGLLIEADTGEILYEKNAHQENYPASLTKIMTALLVFEAIDEGRLSLSDSVTATESALNGLASDGSTANIVAGETMTVEQLLNCMLIVSANETCNILGEYISGSVEAFVARMNDRATELGCEHTHFANATGLHNSQHYTTAWDLYLITRGDEARQVHGDLQFQELHRARHQHDRKAARAALDELSHLQLARPRLCLP